MGSGHVKANKGWEGECKGTIKKAFLRSRTEKKEVWGGIWERRVFGLGTKGSIWLIAALVFLRSWISLKEPLGFLTVMMEVL
jgi:hypothetical protein